MSAISSFFLFALPTITEQSDCMVDIPQGEAHQSLVHHKRDPPVLTTALFAVKETKGAGYGVFANEDIPALTELLISSCPSSYVIYRTFRKEVCAWCFAYERGRNWKVKFIADGTAFSNGGGLVFCCEDCRQDWYGEYGDIGLEAFIALETFIQKQSRSQPWSNGGQNDEKGDDELSKCPPISEVDKVWTIIERQAALIRRHRLRDPLHHESKINLKAEKRAVAEALTLPAVDTDALYFILTGLLCRSIPRLSSSWDTLLMLNPSNPYPSVNMLYVIVNAYLQLLAILPPTLLGEDTLSRETIEIILNRDVGNSFGIWSTADSEEDPEMLGYGTWPVASFFNHSCLPNVSKRRQGRKWTFSTPSSADAPAIRSGTELCITYIRGEEDTLHVDDRRKKLENGWGFICLCPKCVREDTKEIECS